MLKFHQFLLFFAGCCKHAKSGARHKRANRVGLKCCDMKIWLQKSASMKPRTDCPTFRAWNTTDRLGDRQAIQRPRRNMESMPWSWRASGRHRRRLRGGLRPRRGLRGGLFRGGLLPRLPGGLRPSRRGDLGFFLLLENINGACFLALVLPNL